MDVVRFEAGDCYSIHEPIGAGGMATVHLARRWGAAGFARTVAIKRLHPQLASEPDAVATFLEEARLAGLVRHPNVVATLDVVTLGAEPLLVMEYVHGASLYRVLSAARARGEVVPPPIAVAIAIGVLDGLHAAHEARRQDGAPLCIVHRDVSPQNVLVAVDGFARITDFGIARASDRATSTRRGLVKGKVRYMAPEQIDERVALDRRADLFAAAVVLWETLTGARLFRGETAIAVAQAVQSQPIEPPSARAPSLPAALDRVVLRALSRDPRARFADAHDMALALERALPPATARQVGAWVERVARELLDELDAIVARAERADLGVEAPRGSTPRARAGEAVRRSDADDASGEEAREGRGARETSRIRAMSASVRRLLGLAP